MTAWFAPGRLEVFGKHTDYAGGRSLLAAVDRGIRATATDGASGITVTTDASEGQVTLHADAGNGLPVGHWAHYVQTVVDRLTANFGPLRDCSLRIESDLPLASGMSSSSALIVASALSLADHNHLTGSPAWTTAIVDRIDLAGYLACIENGMSFRGLAGNRGVGTFGGSEDHTAMLCCEPDHLTQARFCPIVVEDSVEFPSDHTFVVAVSGVLAEKTGSARELYNLASLRSRELVRVWNEAESSSLGTLAQVLETSPDAPERLSSLVSDDLDLQLRLAAFVKESDELIPAATDALRRGDLATFGALALESHANASTVLRNQVIETDRLVELAAGFGALGASGFGAGFGGSVWALVPTADADDFAASWLRRYTVDFPQHAGTAGILVTRPGSAAHRV